MEPTEKESGEEHHPSLPPNYVSLAQLQERWLQRQKEKQKTEKQEEKREQKQPKQEGGLISASRSQQEKGKKKVWGKEQGKERNGWRRVEGHQKVYVPKGALDGNGPEIGVAGRKLKSEEFKVGALAHHGVNGVGGMEEKIVRRKKNWKKRVARPRVEGNLIGEQETRGTLGDLNMRNGGEEGCREEFGRNDNTDREVEGKVSVCMVGVMPESKGREVTLVGMRGKCGGDKRFGEQDWGYSDDWSLEENSSACTMEVLPENGSGKEVPVAENGDYQGMLEAGSVCMAEVLPQNKVEEDCSVNVGRERGEGRLRARYQHNVDKEMVSGSLLPKIRRDLRFLSLGERRVGNVALRRGRHGWQQRTYEKPRAVNGLVWMKKGEISDTNVPEI